MYLPFCARYLCIMKGEVGGERRKEHNYCFLWQFMAFSFFPQEDQSAVFVSDEHKNLLLFP